MKAFTRNYADNSTEAGYQFTFYCDICNDGFKSSFMESSTYKKKSGLRGLAQGASIVGGLLGGRASDLGYSLQRGTDVISERFEERSPEWQMEHEAAFNRAQDEVRGNFVKCPACQKWVCRSCWNEEEGLCVECAPRLDVSVARARSKAIQNNIDEAAETQVLWKGSLDAKTTICPVCGKPAGSGKFCNNCGASMAMPKCSHCGAQNAAGVKFCSNCGKPMTAAPAPKPSVCPSCGAPLAPGARFCGECGQSI